MAEVHDINDHQGKICEGIDCGSVKFNLLRSGKIECALCGDVDEEHFWLGTEQDNNKIALAIVGMMTLTKDPFKTVVETLIGIGAGVCKENGMDYEQHLIDITEPAGDANSPPTETDDG